MVVRMIFRKSTMKSTRKAPLIRESTLDLAEDSAILASTSNVPEEEYPFVNGAVAVRHLTMQLLVEDNVALDYLLCFSRREFSSEPVELLASHRDLERERTATMFAPDELHLRELTRQMLEAHVADNARQQVTLPSAPANALKQWLQLYTRTDAAKRSSVELPTDDLAKAIHQCKTDVKGDLVPRFTTSPLGEELSKVHPAAMLGRSKEVAIALRKRELSSIESAALDFWLAAHEYAISEEGRKAKGRQVMDTYHAKLPLFEVHVDVCSSIEKELDEPQPKAAAFLTAQIFALNVLSEQYYAMLEGSEGAALLERSGVAKRVFAKSEMPSAPMLDTEEDYANMW